MNLLTNISALFCSSRIKPIWLHLGLLLLIGTAIYSNTFQVPFVLDDNYSLSFFGSSGIHELLFHGGSRRVVDVTFAMNNYIHGMRLTGYHITNLFIHLTATITLYLFVHAAINALHRTNPEEEVSFLEKFVPIATALLFVSHPIQTQAVTYTIQRYTSLTTLFYLLSALGFIRSRYAFEQGQCRWQTWIWGCTSLLASVLAIGSKQIAYTLPLMLVMLEWILFRAKLLNRRFFIICGVLLMLIPAYLIFEWQQGTLDDFLYDLRQATTDNQYISRTTYFLTQTRVIVTYLRLLFLPINQNLFYDYPIYGSFFSVPVMSSLALHCSLIISAVLLVRTSRQKRSQTDWAQEACQRLAALGIVWFYVTLAIESSIIPIRDVIFEHRLYLPSVGFFLTITALAALAIRRQRLFANAAWALLSVTCLVLGGMTFARNRVWNDSLTLWQDTAKKSPNKGIVLANLASEYLQRNMPEKSLLYFSRAIELNPNLDFRAKSGLGISLKELKIYGSRFTTGEEFIRPGGVLNSGTLDYGNLSKWDSIIANNRGLAFEYLGEYDKAWNVYRNSIWINPAYDLAWYNLGLLASRLGEKEQILAAIEQLRTVNPELAKTLEQRTTH